MAMNLKDNNLYSLKVTDFKGWINLYLTFVCTDIEKHKGIFGQWEMRI